MKLPNYIEDILKVLHRAGFEAYVVGGAVRHLAQGEAAESLDNWDVATNAQPEQIQKLFSESFYENKFGTVTIVIKHEGKPLLVEVTPYRIEGRYTDKRHPDEVTFTQNLDEDLARRDFTINAMALGLAKTAKQGAATAVIGGEYVLHDPYGGLKDLASRLVRAVGKPEERFTEDALRLLRAARFATTLGFEIEPATKSAIQKLASHLKDISAERIRDEFSKIIMAEQPDRGIFLLQELGLLKYVMPELEQGLGVTQKGPHRFDVFKHNTLALKFAAIEKGDLGLRLAALLHDVAKPATRAELPSGEVTFYGHNVVGAKMAKKMLSRLKYPKQLIERVYMLVYHHLFFYDVDVVTASSVRRLLVKVGKENINDLISLRLFDRQSTPVPKRKPYKLRHLEYMIDKVLADPLTVTELEIRGEDVMEVLKIEPGPRVGLLLKALLAEVIDEPKLNTKEKLLVRLKALNKETDERLRTKGQRVEQEKAQRDEQIKAKHAVR